MSLHLLVTLAVAVAAVVAQSPLTINTPASVQACLPVQLSWNGGSPPYYLGLIPAGKPGSALIKDFGQQNSNSLTWTVDQPAGTSVSVQIRDSTGAINYSDQVTVQPSTQTCTTGGSTSSGNTSTPSAPKSGTPSASTPSPSSNSSSSSNPTPSSSSPTSSTGGSTAAAKAPTSDASHNIPGFFALGLAATLAVFA